MRKTSAMYQVARPVRFAKEEAIRIATRISGRKCDLPDFLIIGAQKAATTALYNYLLQHPSVCKAVTKEVHFFDNRFSLGVSWYKSNFPQCKDRDAAGDYGIIGEASPYYLAHPYVPERVHSICPDVRLIVLLRDPVFRAISQHDHERRRGFEKLPLKEALAAEQERIAGEAQRLKDSKYRSYAYEHYSYVTRGLYAEQLDRWFALFPRSQLLVLEAEMLRSQPSATLAATAEFLGIEKWTPDLSVSHNPGAYSKPSSAEIEWLRTRFEQPNQRLNALLGRHFSWSMMEAREPNSLIAHYEEDLSIE